MSWGHQGVVEFRAWVYRACKTDLASGIWVSKVQSVLVFSERLWHGSSGREGGGHLKLQFKPWGLV